MAKGARKVDEATMKRAEDAKNQLVSQYLHLGSAMKRCSGAVEAYATALNDATSNEEILALLRAPVAGPMPTGMPEMMPFLTAGGGKEENGGKATGNSKKRSNSEASDEIEVEENGKKKRKSKKKPVDPDAPKRPPSAYILFQNAIRAEMKEKNPDIPYQEILVKTGTAWKELGETEQAPYKEAATLAMANYKANHADYVANGKPEAENGDVSMIDELAATPAVKEKKEKAPKKEKMAPAAAKSTSESKEPAAAKKEKKAAPPSKAAPPPAAVTSTPAAKNAAAPKPVSASSKKNIPQAAADSSSSESEDEESDSEESSGSD